MLATSSYSFKFFSFLLIADNRHQIPFLKRIILFRIGVKFFSFDNPYNGCAGSGTNGVIFNAFTGKRFSRCEWNPRNFQHTIYIIKLCKKSMITVRLIHRRKNLLSHGIGILQNSGHGNFQVEKCLRCNFQPCLHLRQNRHINPALI